MPKDKRSFFERITGTISVADDEADFQTEVKGKPGKGADWLEEEAEEGELSVDVYQTPSHIVVKAMIAGVRPEDLDVTITRDMVTIRGKREQHTEGSAGDFFFQELYWGSFSRTIVLPQEVEVEEAEAVEKHGLLIIRLPKLDKGRQAKLKVKSS